MLLKTKHILTQFLVEKVSVKELPKVQLVGGTDTIQTQRLCLQHYTALLWALQLKNGQSVCKDTSY